MTLSRNQHKICMRKHVLYLRYTIATRSPDLKNPTLHKVVHYFFKSQLRDRKIDVEEKNPIKRIVKLLS